MSAAQQNPLKPYEPVSLVELSETWKRWRPSSCSFLEYSVHLAEGHVLKYLFLMREKYSEFSIYIKPSIYAPYFCIP